MAVQADIINGTEIANMFNLVKAEFGMLDILILNASGGLEKDAPTDYAMA